MYLEKKRGTYLRHRQFNFKGETCIAKRRRCARELRFNRMIVAVYSLEVNSIYAPAWIIKTR